MHDRGDTFARKGVNVSSYSDRHGELYDVFYQGKPYVEEALFVYGALRKDSCGSIMRVLELASGTGTHALELSKLSYELTCVDHSSMMLDQARAKPKTAGAEIRFFHGDMRSARFETLFDAAICLFDS